MKIVSKLCSTRGKPFLADYIRALFVHSRATYMYVSIFYLLIPKHGWRLSNTCTSQPLYNRVFRMRNRVLCETGFKQTTCILNCNHFVLSVFTPIMIKRLLHLLQLI